MGGWTGSAEGMREDSATELVHQACISENLLGTRNHARCWGYSSEQDTVSSPTAQGNRGTKEAVSGQHEKSFVGTSKAQWEHEGGASVTGLQAGAFGIRHPG